MRGIELNSPAIIADWKKELKQRCVNLFTTPLLTIVQVGDNAASNKYISNKLKVAAEIGIFTNHIVLNEEVTQHVLNEVMASAGGTPIILQLPIPEHLSEAEAMRQIDPSCDVDGFTIEQRGKLMSGDESALIPATALGVHRLLKSTMNTLEGKKVAIVNRSNLIGQPLAQLLLKENAIVTMLHSKVPSALMDIELGSSDIVVTGCGKRAIFNSSYFTRGQVLIDCSMNQDPNKPGVGDMDKEDILEYLNVVIASGYGHTGPATVVGLIENTIKVYEQQMQ